MIMFLLPKVASYVKANKSYEDERVKWQDEMVFITDKSAISLP
jgi:hypothetical protein